MIRKSLSPVLAILLLSGCNLFLTLDPADSGSRSDEDMNETLDMAGEMGEDMAVVDMAMPDMPDMANDAEPDMPMAPEGNWISISLGSTGGCGVARGGTVYCWGANQYGQLGYGDSTWRNAPWPIDSTEAFVEVVVGAEHACATTEDGRLFCWGDDDNFGSILGDGVNLVSPTQFAAPDFVELVAGFSHTCGLTAENKMYCLGEDDFGQTGQGIAGDLGIFTEVPGVDAIDIAAGEFFTCYLDLEGKPWCWGRDYLTASEPPTNLMPQKISDDIFVSIDAGEDHICALDADGSAHCWGRASWLGTLTSGTDTSVPSELLTGLTWKKLDSGQAFTCGLATDDMVYCWGGNRRGKLANGGESPTDDTINPVAPIVKAGPYRDFSVGTNHGCALDEIGDAFCWGHNNQGRVGIGVSGEPPTPQLVITDQNFVKVVSGEYSSCALTDGSEVYCWGRGNYDALGNGQTDEHALTPERVEGLANVSDIVMSGSSVCAVTTTDVQCWGDGNYGILGTGSRSDQARPTSIAGNADIRQLTLGNQTACGVTAMNQGYCWGYGNILADNVPNGYVTTPQMLSSNHGPYRFIATSTTDHFCAIGPNGNGYCWGDNGDGELGDGMGGPNTFVESIPVTVAGGHSWKVLELGTEVTCGITDADAGYCWGEGNQHGLGTSNSIMTPTELPGSRLWRNIDLFGSGGCGATMGGDVYCWGANNRNRLGNLGSSSSPRKVDGVEDAVWASLGDDFGCAATSIGDTYCWGARTHGRLGDGINAIIHEPTPIDLTNVEIEPLD